MYQTGNRLHAPHSDGNRRDNIPSVAALCLIRIANYRALRRELGLQDVCVLVQQAFDNLERHSTLTELTAVGPDVIECKLALNAPEDLKRELYNILTSFGTMHLGIDMPQVEYFIGASHSIDGIDDVGLIERAEHALSKASYNKPIVISDDVDAAQANDRENALIDALPYAAMRDELVLVYQPKLNVRKREIQSCEALIRWNHPDLGLIMPDSFIHIADRTGEIAAITLWAIERTIMDQRVMRESGHVIRIFVNISACLLTDSDFVKRAVRLVTQADADIGFEITETSVIHDPEIAIENVTYCVDSGISLAIDDYGSGLSSLAYLKRLPASELKIDKMFVMGLTSSHRDPLIVRSTIDLAHALDMKVTAEGVETPATLALLSVMGCDFVQGYFISAGRSLDGFVSYLDEFMFPLSEEDEKPSLIRPASFWGK